MLESISPTLLARLHDAAAREFESPESYLARVLNKALPGRRTRNRNGGKPPASKLRRAVKRSGVRGQVLAHFLQGGAVTVASAMEKFGCSRPCIFANLTALRLYHGVGYIFEAATDSITVRLPCPVDDVFG